MAWNDTKIDLNALPGGANAANYVSASDWNGLVSYLSGSGADGTINVKAAPYNAVGDGTTDDTTAVQAAIDAATTANGLVYFPTGIYKITSTLTYTRTDTGHTITLEGSSASRGLTGSVLKWAGTANGTLFRASGANTFRVSRLCFEGGGGSNFADNLLYFYNAGSNPTSGITIRDCVFSGGSTTSKSAGIRFGTDTHEVSEGYVDGCSFQSLYYGIVREPSGANVKNFSISNCGFLFCYWGIADSPIGGHFSVTGCNFGFNGNVPGGFFSGIAGREDEGGAIWANDILVQSCETESGSRFITSEATIGNNPGHITAINNHVELGNVPADGYVIRAGGALTMLDNVFFGGPLTTDPAKIQVFSLNNKFSGAATNSQGAVSMNNWYANASTYAPIYDGSNGFIPSAGGLSYRVPLISMGDLGWAGGTQYSLEEIIGSASTLLGGLQQETLATGLSYAQNGLLAVGMNKMTLSYTSSAFTAANTTVRKQIWTIPARTKVTSVVADVTTPFAGLAGTINMILGDSTGSENQFILSFDAKTAAVTRGLASGDLGASLGASASQGGAYYWTGGVVRARFDSGVGNFGNGSTTNLSNGVVTVYITIERMP